MEGKNSRSSERGADLTFPPAIPSVPSMAKGRAGRRIVGRTSWHQQQLQKEKASQEKAFLSPGFPLCLARSTSVNWPQPSLLWVPDPGQRESVVSNTAPPWRPFSCSLPAALSRASLPLHLPALGCLSALLQPCPLSCGPQAVHAPWEGRDGAEGASGGRGGTGGWSLARRRSLFPQPGKGDEAEGETDKHMLVGAGVEGS